MSETTSKALRKPTRRVLRDVLRRFARGESYKAIGKIHGRSEGTIHGWMEKAVERGRGWPEAVARARRAAAAHHANRAVEVLEDPDVLATVRNSPAAMSQHAERRAAQHRWHSSRLDRDNWGDSVKVDGRLNVAIVAAFVDMAPTLKPDAKAEAAQLPKVVPPDGGQC